MLPTGHTTNIPGRKSRSRVYGALCTLLAVPTAPLAMVSLDAPNSPPRQRFWTLQLTGSTVTAPRNRGDSNSGSVKSRAQTALRNEK